MGNWRNDMISCPPCVEHASDADSSPSPRSIKFPSRSDLLASFVASFPFRTRSPKALAVFDISISLIDPLQAHIQGILVLHYLSACHNSTLPGRPLLLNSLYLKPSLCVLHCWSRIPNLPLPTPINILGLAVQEMFA